VVSSEKIDQSTGRVRLERPATGGAVGRLDDGRVVFVRHALPGELVRVEVTESTSKFSRADAVEILEASPDRVVPPCRYAHPGGCGGCDLQHASTSAQIAWKASLVAEHLRRIAGEELDVSVVEPSSEPEGSRTRLRCAVTDDGRLALRAARSHDLITLDACWIADQSFTPAFASPWHGADEVELRAIGEGEPFAVVRRLTPRGTMHELCSFRGEPLEPSMQSRVNVRGHVFSVGPRSFWQSHRDAPTLLLDHVLELAGARADDHVADLFSGVGLFAVPLAKVVGPGGRVTAVESSPYAVRDARQNAEGLRNLKVREWSVTPRSVNDAVGEGDLVVVDPPRGGLAKGVAETLVRRRPRRLVYVSCDAATFARDLKILLAGGFELSDLRAFDLFPMTEHVELIARLDFHS
jgi:tRNA/tmRNA/rRNA uracil-C5-methylase (TrmA/RlmC/RlmD family)